MLLPARTGAAPAAHDATSAGAPPTRIWRAAARARAAGIPAEIWVLGALTVLGAALRFATIASQSYWFDESQAVHELRLSFGGMLSAIGSNEPNPPFYFLIGWLWGKVLGTSEAGLRSLSGVAGTAVIPIAYLCGRELVSRRAGLFAAAFAALNPFMIWYSQEAREYMLLAALCGASLLFFARAWRRPSPRHIAWWTVFSALALLTQYFAGFLVAGEAIVLLYVARNRVIAAAAGALAVVEVALVPHLLNHASHPLGWIDVFPLSIRIQQVPVQFGLGALYQSSLVTDGLLGAAVLAGCLIVLLIVGTPSAQLRGAALAGAVAAFVVLVPLLLAALGHDYYVPRALMPAWIPLAIVIGAACAAPRLAAAGAALGAVLLGGFVYAGIAVAAHPQYQRPDWRGVAAALGHGSGPRAIVAYDGGFASGPLAIYLHGVPWSQSAAATVTVGEVDVVGSTSQTRAQGLPAGVTLIASRAVNSYLVERFSLHPAWHLTPAAIGARAGALLAPAPPSPAVLIQRPPA
ncbi:MAG: glycosyltransferase family 39 protein [Solirubrobacteraceae bacterium]